MTTSNMTVEHFAGHRKPAWLGLGNAFDHEVTDSAEMMRLSGLDQILYSEQPLEVSGMPDAHFIAPVKALVHENIVEGTSKVLGIVGETRPLIQPSEGFAFLQSLKDGARWETAGTVRQGRTVFGQIALDREIVLDPTGASDVTKTFLLVAWALDGTLSLQGGATAMRGECSNTLNIAVKDAAKSVQSFKIKQTKNARDRMQVEAELWRNTHSYFDAFEIQAKALYEAAYSDKQFENAFLAFYPKPAEDKGPAAMTKWESKRANHFAMWNAPHNAGVKGTAWGAANVLTEVNQWFRGVRQGEAGAERFALAGAGFDGPTNDFRNRAFALVGARAGIDA